MKYSARDITEMRASCRSLALMDMSGGYTQNGLIASAEQMLVTHMSNETTPHELKSEVERREAERYDS